MKTTFISHPEGGRVVAILLPLIGIVASLGCGIPYTADGPLHVQRIQAMTIMLRQGYLWPRWVPYFHLGFGYPIFNFYPPGVFYLGGVLGLFGISAQLAFVIIAALAWVIGTMGMYTLARRFLPTSAALFSALLWAYAPSRLYEVWDQGSLPQMMSAALVPWLFYGLVMVARVPARRYLLLTAFSLAGIVLTHLPIAFITALYVTPTAVILPFLAARTNLREFPRRFAYTAAGLLLGAGLTAIFVLPMALELQYVGASTEDENYYISHLMLTFLRAEDIFAPVRQIDLTDLNRQLPATLGQIEGILGVVGLAALVIRRQYALALTLAASLAFTIFMLLDYSLDVWLEIPFFRQLRYPERFMRVGVVFLALLGGFSLQLIPARWRSWGMAGGMLVVLLSAMPLFYSEPGFVEMPNQTALDEIEFEMTEHVWGTTSYDEFDPNWGQRIPLPGEVPEPERYVTNPLRLVGYRLDVIKDFPALNVEELDDHTIRVTAENARPVRFHQYYFPGWTATLDGKPVEVYAEEEMGLITIDVPAGEHLITLHYTGTTAQKTGTAITLASLGAAFILLIARRPARAFGVEQVDRLSYPASVTLVGSIIGVTLITSLYITPQTGWFRQESTPENPVYMETPVHQSFGGDLELLGYTLRDTRTAPGGWLEITLFWRPEHTLSEDYRPIVQLVNMNVTEAWAVSEPPTAGGGHTIGHPPDHFFSDVHRMKVNDDAPPYVGLISVQMLQISTGELLRLPDGSDRLLLDVLIPVKGNGPQVKETLNYDLGELVELRCASIETVGELLNVDLYWHVNRTPEDDLVVFVHGRDAHGNLIEQNDSPPLAGDYPTTDWQPGQNLVDHHILAADPAIYEVAVGLYHADNGRLPVAQDGTPIPDDTIVLPVQKETCLE